MLKTLNLSLEVLECFKKDKDTWTSKELAIHLDENHTKIYRIVETLAGKNYLKKDDKTKEYRLGNSILELSTNMNSKSEIKNIVHPYLLQITEKTEESSFLTLLDETVALTLDSVEGKNQVRFAVSIGSTAPLYAGASYRSILAFLPDHLINTLLNSSLKKFTNKTLNDSDLIIKDLEKIRLNNYSISVGEMTEDVKAIAVPIFINKKIIGSITIAGPSYRLDKIDNSVFLEALFEARKLIEDNEELQKLL